MKKRWKNWTRRKKCTSNVKETKEKRNVTTEQYCQHRQPSFHFLLRLSQLPFFSPFSLTRWRAAHPGLRNDVGEGAEFLLVLYMGGGDACDPGGESWRCGLW